MLLIARRLLAPALAVVCLAAAGPALALTPEVKDQAGFFKPEAIKQANQLIRDIQRQHHVDLMIETFVKPPAGREQEASADHWQRFSRSGLVNAPASWGLMAFTCSFANLPRMCKWKSATIQGRKHSQKKDRTRLVKILLSRFNAKEYDEGLLEGVRLVRDTVDRNLASGGRRQAAAPVPAAGGGGGGKRSAGFDWTGLICPGIVVLVVIWVIFAVIRGLSGMGGAAEATAADPVGVAACQDMAPGMGAVAADSSAACSADCSAPLRVIGSTALSSAAVIWAAVDEGIFLGIRRRAGRRCRAHGHRLLRQRRRLRR